MEARRNEEIRLILNVVGLIVREFLDFPSSSDIDEDFDAIEQDIRRRRNRRRRRIPRLENYVEMIGPAYNDTEFQSHFRMKRETFEYVLNMIAPRLRRNHAGLSMIPPEKQFLLALWRLATPDSYRSICEKFNVSRSTALYAVRRVTKALVSIAPAIIRWPTQAAVQSVWTGFEAISAFPKVIGAIDGKHIHIPAPNENPESYVNRKGYPSVQLQAICDHKTRFTHCFVGHAGSVHDQRVFRLSDVQGFLGDPEKFPDDCHLVGDLAYKLHDNLLIAYRDNGHLTERQRNFNFCLSSARIAIERAFGLLTCRFRSLLTVLPMSDMTQIPDFVLACCVLHNICLLRNDELAFAFREDVPPNPAVGEEGGVGVAKRDLICERLQLRDV